MKYKVVIPLLIILIAIIIAAMLSFSKPEPEKKEAVVKPFLVDTLTAELQSLNFIVRSQGSVTPKVRTILSSQVNGKVVEINPVFIEGGFFKKGEVLLSLESADYVTDYKLAKAELARAKASLQEEIARGKVAEEEWRSVSNNSKPELGLRKPQLEREKANLSAAEANVSRAQRNLSRTQIKAPFDGLVKSKQVDLGQFIAAGSPLAELYATDVAEVRMPLTDNDLAYLQLSDSAQVDLHTRVAGKAVSWKGSLSRNEGILDEKSRVIYVVAEVQDPYQRKLDGSMPLRFGSFVQAEIIGIRGQDLIVLPRHVLRLDQTVLTVNQNNEIEIKPVEVQRADDKYVYISGGLQSGELIITTAVPNPYNGQTVRFLGQTDLKTDPSEGGDNSNDVIQAEQ
jgi:RND family efflux transporter MFP subunit